MKRRILVCVLLGLVTSVGVAVAIGRWPTPEVDAFRLHQPNGDDYTPWWVPRPEGYQAKRMYREAGIGWSMVELDRYPNAMVFYEVEKIRNDPSTAWASGFPFYCLRRVILVGKGNSVNQFRWVPGMGIPLLDGPLNGPASTRVVPLGLVANTAFYGGLWALPLIAWPALRTRRRMARGLCTRCAYPVAGLTMCPECGRAVGC